IPAAADQAIDPTVARALIDGMRRIWAFESSALTHARSRYLAHVELAEGRHEEGLDRLEPVLVLSAHELPRAAPYRAIDHVAAADALITLGRADDAVHHTEVAAGLLANWPGWRRDALTAVERRLGRGPAGA